MKLQFFLIGTLLFLCLAGIGEAGLLRKHLQSVLKRFGNSTILSRHPELRAKFASIRANISQCYDPTVGGKKVADIFRQTLGEIAHIYFDSHSGALENLTLKKIAKRVGTFIKNVRSVAKIVLDCLERKPSERARYGLTPISAYAQEEFIDLNKLPRQQKLGSNQSPLCSLEAKEQLPAKFSWLDQGFKSPIRYQGATQWCIAYSLISALEFAYQIKNKGKPPQHFSQQSPSACVAGTTSKGMVDTDVINHIKKHGVMLEKDAPINVNDMTCRTSPRFEGLNLVDWCDHYRPHPQQLPEQDLLRMIYRNGPTEVWVNSRDSQFLYHKHMLYNGPCDSTTTSHAVLAIGWDESTILLQNSWGDWWGEGGYFRLPRGQNKCGVMTMAGSVLLA